MWYTEKMRQLVSNHRGVVTILITYLALAVVYGVTIPLFESPDAGGHYAFINELTNGRGLPIQGTASGERVTGYVTSHPPVYYLLSAALTFWVSDDTEFAPMFNPYHAMGYPDSVANKNYLVHHDEGFPWQGTALTAHIARLVSAGLGAVAVLATYLIALDLFPKRRWLALGAASLTAFNPMFVFTGARISNDAAIACFGGLTLWGATRLAVSGLSNRGLALTGIAWGLAILSKFSGTTLGPAVALALLFDVVRAEGSGIRDVWSLIRHPRRPLIVLLMRNALILFGAAALVCGWWFARNLVLYDELLGVDAWLSHTETVRPDPLGFFDVIPQLEGLERSYWAVFGWFNISVADWVYYLLWWMVRLALLGCFLLVVDQLIRRGAKQAPRSLPRATRSGMLVLATGFTFAFASVWRFIMIVLGSQGRYLLPAVAAISVFLMLGLARLVSQRFEPVLSIALSLGLCLFAVAALVGYILPAYSKPVPVVDLDLPSDMPRFNVRLGDTPVELIGGRIHQQSAHPDDVLTVDIYWRSHAPIKEDYMAYVHLLGQSLNRIGNFDGYPGGGTFPTSLWQPNQIYRDRYRIPLDPQAEAPTVVWLDAGLIGSQGWLTPTLATGEPSPGLLKLDVLALRPRHDPKIDVQHRLQADLQSAPDGDRITLIGGDISRSEPQPGGVLTLTLAWQANSVISRDYQVFVHLRDEANQTVAQADGPPRDGNYPTSFWAPGEKVIDTRLVRLPPELRSGTYRLVVGLYHLDTRQRLSLPNGINEVELPFEVTVG